LKKKLVIIWDYDGTLVDSSFKNLVVTREIIELITSKKFDSFDPLKSKGKYWETITSFNNWRDFYSTIFHLNAKQTDEAGALWSEYQKKNLTPINFIVGIKEVVHKLRRYPQGIVSQNSHEEIISNLKRIGVLKYFGSVIGYEEVDLNRQKPDPAGLLLSIDELFISEVGTVIYIGDQESDIECAVNANKFLKEQNRKISVINIAVDFKGQSQFDSWKITPQYLVTSPQQIIDIVKSIVAGDIA